MKRLVLLVCALAGWHSSLEGALLLTDSFDYPNGALVSVSAGAWVHHNGSTTGEVNVLFAHVFLTQSETEDVSAPLAGQPYPATTNILLYSSFTVNLTAAPSGAGNFFAHYKAGGTTGAQAGKVFVTTNGVPPGFFQVGVANTASTPVVLINSNLAYNTDYRLVTRYALSNSATTLWLDPTVESDPSITATDQSAPITVVAFALRQSLSSGDGMGGPFLDDIRVGTSFSDVVSNAPPQPPTITSQPQNQTVFQRDNVTFTVLASGSAPLSYQWQFYSTNLAGATNSSLALTNVTAANAGPYIVTVTNTAGLTNSQPAILTVNPLPVAGFSMVTYNVKGNGANDWTTNAPQVRAIARQLQFLNPDIITFNEIPFDLSYEMTNFVAAFLPGYSLAQSPNGDGFIRSSIASRFPITRSQSWLAHVDLKPFGYTNANPNLDNFTRDLFEAQISVPHFPQPLHVFTTHLKATSGNPADDGAKRAAEASAISNYFVTGFLTTNALHTYVLTGDLNEDINRPVSTNQPVQRLISTPTGLQLTTPRNPFNNDDRTWSIQGSLSVRLDYLLPGGLLFSNIGSSQVFRTDLLTNPPPPLLTNDDVTASDHLPVLMVFNNPYDKPYRLLSIARSFPSITLTWQSVPGQSYRVDSSSNLMAWEGLASNLVANGTTYSFVTNVNGSPRFYRVHRVP